MANKLFRRISRILLRNGVEQLPLKSKVRDGWEKAFAAYAEEGEDKMLLTDFIDSETTEISLEKSCEKFVR